MSLSTPEATRPRRARRVLDNGLIAIVLERRHLPVVSATLLVPAGTAHEPAERGGVANFVSQVLPMGTRKRSATALAEAVDGIGASLSAGCDYDYATVDLTGLARDAGLLLDLLAEVALDPPFQPEEVERKRSQILGNLERRKDDHADVVRHRFLEMVYREHPYHRRKEGTVDSVTRTRPEDLAAFHAAAYAPKGAILALVGDVGGAEGLGWIEERFGGWRRERRVEEPGSEMPRSSARALDAIQQDVTQAYIRLGNIGVERNTPDFAATALMNYILGGAGFGSRLMSNLREQKGLTYGVHSNFLTRRQPGYFFVATQTRMEMLNLALQETLAEIDRFRQDGATAEEIDRAKRFYTGSLPLSLETNDQIAQKLLEQELYGLEDEFWLHDLDRLRAVTHEDVLSVARRHIRPDEFSIVVLGDFRQQPLDRDAVIGSGRAA